MALALSTGNEVPFVRSPYIVDLMERATQYLKNGLPINLIGPPGVGKTTLAISLGQELGRPSVFVQGHHDMRVTDLVGGFQGYRYHKVVDNFIRDVFKVDEQMESHWTEGWLSQAIKKGHTVIFDEFSRIPTEVQSVLLAVLQEHILPVSRIGHTQTIPVHPQFRLIMTSGMPEQIGVYPVLEGLLDRIITISLETFDETTEVMIVSAHSHLPLEESQQIVRLIRHIRYQTPSRRRKSSELAVHRPSIRMGVALAGMLQAEGWSLARRQLPKNFSQIVKDLCGPFSTTTLKDIEGFLVTLGD